ncbi:MAG: hypothetical protein KJN84_16355, partial [Bacteroidia bacterium]|nr:hypothetical protein [Bacteroidia bacterium]
MITGIFYALIGIAIIILMRSVTTFVHEMGHAIPALLFTKDDVIVCLGSYADVSGSKAIKIGRLIIYFRLNVFGWKIGLCSHKPINNYLHEMIVILGGPFASLCLAIVTLILVLGNNLNDGLMSLATLFILSTGFDFFTNIIPTNNALYLFNGNITYNDGQQFVNLWRKSNLPEAFFKAKEAFNNEDYKTAKDLLESLIDQNYIKDNINRLLIDTYIKLGEFDNAIDNMTKYSSEKKLKTEDNAKIAYIFYELGAYEKALNYIDNAIHYDYKNAFHLYQRGLIKEKLEDYNGAVIDYRAAATYNEGYADPYASMGRVYFA